MTHLCPNCRYFICKFDYDMECKNYSNKPNCINHTKDLD